MQGKNEKNSIKPSRRRASKQKYISPNQLTICGFETPFEQQLTKENRWVKMAAIIPWDKIVGLYQKQFTSKEGRPPINGRIIIGAVIIKHILNLSDRETVLQIQENMFMQFFLGYASFTNEAPFDHSLFCDIRERLNESIMKSISEVIIAEGQVWLEKPNAPKNKDKKQEIDKEDTPPPTHKGNLLMDATVSPQNITFPTDLKLLNASRLKSEELIDKLFDPAIHLEGKPRTYRKIARKEFLVTQKKKRKTHKEITEANTKQLQYLKRNLGHLENLTKTYLEKKIEVPLKEKEHIETIKKVYEQQQEMVVENKHRVADRIVNIHQPHVRPIVRGKEKAKAEFGSKIQVSYVDGFSMIERLDWNNFNEGLYLVETVENYKKRYGYYPQNVLADKIYCNRENRAYLKEKGIQLKAKPLGRPREEAVSEHVSPGERNPIEGKFGQAKVGYGMNNILAKLKTTSESWIGSIFMVLNLVRLMRLIPHWLQKKYDYFLQDILGHFVILPRMIEFNSRLYLNNST